MNTWDARTYQPWRDPRVWGGALLVGGVLLAGLWVALAFLGKAGGPAAALPARVTVIPAPTATPAPPTTPTPAGATATPLAPPPPLPGSLGVGVFVQIRGTGGDGLRVRTQPGLGAPIVFLAKEGEVFHILAGPRQADGYTWWRLTANGAPERTGWAVSNYLSVLPTPPVPPPSPTPTP